MLFYINDILFRIATGQIVSTTLKLESKSSPGSEKYQRNPSW
jgi:hypothetical protein